MVYGLALATAGNTATNGSANTESTVFYFKPGTRNVALQSMYCVGKGAGLTAISGIVIRIVKFATAGTSGTTITPSPSDPGMQAAKMTSTSGQTVGTGTRTNHRNFGFGAAGPGGWVAPNPDSLIVLEGSATNSVEALSASGTVSLNFEWSAEAVE
jgi:hypothetical protein